MGKPICWLISAASVEALPRSRRRGIDPGAAKPREEAGPRSSCPAADQVRLFGKGLSVDIGADRLGGDAPFVDGPVTAHVRSGHCLVGVCLVDVAGRNLRAIGSGDVNAFVNGYVRIGELGESSSFIFVEAS